MNALVSITPDFYYSGLAIPEYMAGMTKNREMFEENYRSFALTDDETSALRLLEGRSHVLVLTEDWCGDAIRYLPELGRMAEVVGDWDIRVFYRDEHPELGGRWLKHDEHRAIPVVVFFDADWNELAYFVEKPEPVYGEELAARAAFAAQHSDLPDAALPAGEMSQPTLDLFAPYMRAFRQANTDRWQHLFVGEIIALKRGPGLNPR